MQEEFREQNEVLTPCYSNSEILENKMDYQFEISAEAKQFLNEHFAAPVQQLLYEHCTAALGSSRRSLLEAVRKAL